MVGEIKRYSVYIMISNTRTLFNNAIGLYTSIPYNHVSIALKKDLYHLYSFARKHPRNPLIGGFVREEIRGRFFSYFPDTKCVILERKVTSAQYSLIKQILKEFEEEKEKYKFNFVGVLLLAFNWPVNRTNAYFCSQFVAEVLNRANVPLFPKCAASVTPKDFWHLIQQNEVNLIYEGALVHYPYHRKSVRVG